MLKHWRYVVAALIVVAASSCSPVKPWERGILARPTMALEPNPIEARIRGHVADSKTGSSGGFGIGGGGCGCS